ncbi:MAG TPA: response regulator [Methylomirabilota bacterium]|nr:response regulator [Methylomirabilota bacterium]
MKTAGYQILLAEDDEIDVMLLKRAFTQANRSTGVHALSNGAEVISYLEGAGQFSDRTQFPLPHLLLLDLKMPIKSGFEVLQWMRTQAHLKRLPVIVMSSSRLTRDIDRAYELGANTYFVKSTEPEQFAEVIRLIEQYWREHAEKPSLPSEAPPGRGQSH